MSLFGGDNKKGLFGDVLGPEKPFSSLDRALSPSQADAMDKVNRYQAGHYDHGLSFTDSLFADTVKDPLDLTLTGIGQDKKKCW